MEAKKAPLWDREKTERRKRLITKENIMFLSLADQIHAIITCNTTSVGEKEHIMDNLYGKWLGFCKEEARVRYAESNTRFRDIFLAMDEAHCYFMRTVEEVEERNRRNAEAAENYDWTEGFTEGFGETGPEEDDWVEASLDASPADEIEAIENGECEGQFIPPYSTDSAPFV